MEIRKKGKVKEFFKRFGVYIGAVVLVLALTITGLTIGLTNKVEEPKDPSVSTGPLNFSAPMVNAQVMKDFSADEIQENITLDLYEAHLAMDLTSEDGIVYSVLGGTVIDVGYNYATGNQIVIEHDNGFVSIYSSLDSTYLVQKDEKVTAGQAIGSAGTSSTDEELQGAHLHFVLKLNDQKVDPNTYIEFQKK